MGDQLTDSLKKSEGPVLEELPLPQMAQLDGSLQRLVLLDAFLKAQVGELRSRVEEGGRREGRTTWDPACKVFIGGLKSSMGRLQLKVTNAALTVSW